MPSLADVEREALACTRCVLANGRKSVVFGVGDPTADLMFVGEGPGEQEDIKGEPFVGRSGKLLDRLVLEELGLARNGFYIANVVKCLRYNAQVQLGDGSWERIGRLVRSTYGGTVMSVDDAGRLVPRPVVGWHASPLGDRRVFRMTYRSAKRAGAHRVSVQLTGDHPVLTPTGFIPVQELQPGALIATGHGLSAVAMDVVCGTLLGDGHLNVKSAYLSIAHSQRQADYAELKCEALAELRPRMSTSLAAAVVGGETLHSIVVVRTRAHRALRFIRSEFYKGEKVVPAWIAESLNPRMLAFWFMDDGHLRVRPPRQPSAEIATCSFSSKDLGVLSAGLARLGLPPKTVRGRLHFSTRQTLQLSTVIAPFVPPSMRYKLHPDVRLSVPFDPAHLAPGRPEVMYEGVELEDITDNPRTDRTFYCIDVEGTHNFVTAGGVVHNCRPPGNRDPRPEEIAACSPYLISQLDLIAPKVVVTLGNFATKLLLQRAEGITQLRGRAYPYRNGHLVPTFHPSAVLRSPGLEAQMRADLIRAKQLIRSSALPA